MTRTLFASLMLSSPAFAVGVIAPIPRLPEAELRPASQPPKTEPDPAKPDEMEDPAKVVERIQQTAEAVGDRLKDKDTGTDTRKQQEQLLKDIDSLLKPPPPMNGEGGGGSDKNMNDMPPPMGGGGMGGGMSPPMGGGGGGGGGGRQRQPRGSKGEGKPDQQPMGAGGMNEPMPKPMGMGQGQPMPGQPMGAGQQGQPAQPGGTNPGTGGGQKSPPALPLDVPIAKEVWGHLPDKMRQEVSQYYREQYLPRYNELLKQYYTALAERERKK